MSFGDTWDALQSTLSVGTVIPNWTAHHGPMGDSFSVTALTSKALVVDSPGAKRLQTIPAADFKEVYDLWNEYSRGRLERSAFTPLTRYSKYIISILRWLEESRGGSLP